VIYQINNIVRLCLFFKNPNELAVVLVMVWGVSLYLLSFVEAGKSGKGAGASSSLAGEQDAPPLLSRRTLTRSGIARFSCLLVIIVASIVSLSATYSRSGMVAFLVVACVLWRSRGTRHWIVMSLIVWAFCLMLVPEAGGRFSRIEPLTDESITHRFDVWRGTLAMSLERPWTGFGIRDFGEILTKWYLPVNNLDTIYVTAVSTPLTILGLWGYPILFAYLCLWLLLLIAGFHGFRQENRSLTICFVIQMTFLISGIFSFLHNSKILNIILLASIVGTIVFYLIDVRAWKTYFFRWCVTSASVSAVICGLLAVVGQWIFSEGYAVHRVSLGIYGKSTGVGWILTPTKPCDHRLVWFVPNGEVKEYAQLLCRPLASQGWEVFMLEAGAGELIAPEVASAFLHGSPLFATNIDQCVVGGIRDDGLAALALASKLSQE